jgi:hypothetical protein
MECAYYFASWNGIAVQGWLLGKYSQFLVGT